MRRSNVLENIFKDKDYKEAKSVMGLLHAICAFLGKTYNDTRYSYMFSKSFRKETITSYVHRFEKALEYYNKGNLKDSINTLKNILIQHGEWILEKCTLDKGSITYRLRSSKSYDLYERKEIFHMPFESISIQGSQRYSISGFPCLYLGASIYDCWEETRRPDLSKVNYAAFKNMRKLRLLDISCPEHIEGYKDVIKFFVFCLCGKYVDPKEDENKFKYQYVVPELILSILVEMMRGYNKTGIPKDMKFDGIRYLSSRFYEDFNMYKQKPIWYNYIVPIREHQKEGHCPELKKIFTVSEPKADFKNKMQQVNFVPPMIRRNNYDMSYFRMLEFDIENSGCKEFEFIKD